MVLSCSNDFASTLTHTLTITDVADAILEYFLEAATKEFIVGRVDREQWHPDFCSSRVAIYMLVKKQKD